MPWNLTQWNLIKTSLIQGSLVLVALCLCSGVALGATSTGVPGKEITAEEMRRAFPKPLERSSRHMPFSPGPAPLIPEALPMRVPEPQRPAAAAPKGVGGTGGGGAPSTLSMPPRKSVQAEADKGGTPAFLPVSPTNTPAATMGATTDTAPLPGSPLASPVSSHSGPPAEPSVEMMVGQMLMVGFGSAELKNNAPVLDLAARGIIGGVILLPHDARGPRNITSPAQVRVLTATLQKAAQEGKGSGGVPLFLAVEQEGGIAQALDPKMGFEGGAAAARLGRGSTEATSTAARRMGLEMVALGLNFNFAPVADVNVNPLSEDIGKKFRSFSPNPAQAGEQAVAFGQGMAAAGIIPCLKYFPGTGSVVSNGFAPAAGEAHFGPPDLAGTWQMLELTPFREALRQQWPGAVQPALAYHRGLDSLYPATLSARMLTDILREQLGFTGVIVSNDLEALGKFYPLEDALLLAVRAGADVLLLPARGGIAPAAVTPDLLAALKGQSGGLEGLLGGQGGHSGGAGGLAGGLAGLLGGQEGLPSELQGAGGNELSGLGALSGAGGLGAGGLSGALSGALSGGAGEAGAEGLAGLLSSSGLLPGMQRGRPEKTGQVSDNVTRAHAALVQMVRDGRIPQERLRQSWHRIMKLKKKFVYSEMSRTNP